MKASRIVREPFLVVLLAVAPMAFAKPKLKTYLSSCDQVWSAVKKATSPPHYNFAQFDDYRKKGLISTGNAWTGKRYMDIALASPTPNTCTVAVDGQYSGIMHNDTGDLYARIKEAMKADTQAVAPPAGQPAPPPQK